MSQPVIINSFAILGFGVTGKSILNFSLKAHIKKKIEGKEDKIVVNIYDEKNINKNELSELLHNKLGLSRDQNSLAINIYSDLEELIDQNQDDLQLIITSPGIKPSKLINLNGINLYEKFKVVSDLELFLSDPSVDPGKIFAITGTNGKSTACHLLAYLLEEDSKQNKQKNQNKIALGGNFGTPVLDFLDSNVYESYVLELSSYQLAITNNLRCLAASCLNISIDHLDWHGSYENYINDKLKIYSASKFDVINLDQKILLDYYFNDSQVRSKDPKIIAYTTSEATRKNFIKARGDVDPILWIGDFLENTSGVINSSKYINLDNLSIIALNNLPPVLQSKHNLSNLLAVLGLLLANFYNYFYFYEQEAGLEVNLKTNLKTNLSAAVNYLEKYLVNIKSYAGLPFRCQLVNEYKSIKVFNDSKSTNLDASIVALDSLKDIVAGKIWLILGGLVKEDVDDLATQNAFRSVLDDRIGGVVVYGKNSADRAKLLKIIETNKTHSFKVIVIHDESVNKQNNESVLNILDKMIQKIFSYAKINDAILFSPACASFDMFNNYIHRGEMFNQRIANYITSQ